MFGFMDIVGKAFVNTNKKGKSDSCICYYWILTFNVFDNKICFFIYSGRNW
jgi:hypothetical protein